MESLETRLRPLLQPLTQNLPTPIATTVENLLGPVCYRSLMHNITLTDSACLQLALSKTLGIAIVGASAVVKIPQLLKLLSSQSAAGVSFLSYALETAGFVVSLAYNIRRGFAFSTYGELALILIQNVAISTLVLRLSGRSTWAAAFVAVLASAAYLLLDETRCSMDTLQWLQMGAGGLSVASKVPQIVTIFQEGGTGELSAFAVFNYLIGSLTRIFTTLAEVSDPLILYGFLAGGALNAVLAVQMLYYWNADAAKRGKRKKNGAAKTGAEGATNGQGGQAQKNRNKPRTRRRG